MKRMIFAILLSIAALTVFAGTKYAVLLGSNTYEYNPNTLRYAEKDVADMKKALESVGFEIQTLTGSQMTKAAIRAAIRRISDRSAWEDLLIVYFSGHGSGGEGNQKGIHTYYSEDIGDSEYYTQEQMIQDMSRFKGKRVLILDACLQGVTTKDWERKQSMGVPEVICPQK